MCLDMCLGWRKVDLSRFHICLFFFRFDVFQRPIPLIDLSQKNTLERAFKPFFLYFFRFYVFERPILAIDLNPVVHLQGKVGLEVGPEVGVEAARRTGEINLAFLIFFLLTISLIWSHFCGKVESNLFVPRNVRSCHP